MTERAFALGWSRAAIDVIDDDQGRSGSSAEGRSGFQLLMMEISADRVGLILGLEMSRLAQSCKDWHALLELCAIYRTLVLIRDRFPAYIGWDAFENNQQKLRANSHLGKALSAPRHGPSVLSGLVVCGRCGHRMLVNYANVRKDSKTKSLRYSCQRDAIDYGGELCQSLSGQVLENFVIERLLQAVSPASLELSLAASADIEQERKQLAGHWQQRLVRSRYEVEQARRQYAAVDPEHRLVARELERQRDEALRADEQLQAEHEKFLAARPERLGKFTFHLGGFCLVEVRMRQEFRIHRGHRRP